MTPKEKANELISKFTHPVRWKMGQEDVKERAKQCALIAVDEILKFDLKAKSEPQFVIEKRIDEYWNEVKQEIEKL